MQRPLTAIGIALALVGSAHAQEQQVTVSLHGKSHAAIRTELHRAAEQVCYVSGSVLDSVDTSCVEATYEDALRQMRTRMRLQQTALAQPAPSDPR